jgi:hypothetical protein
MKQASLSAACCWGWSRRAYLLLVDRDEAGELIYCLLIGMKQVRLHILFVSSFGRVINRFVGISLKSRALRTSILVTVIHGVIDCVWNVMAHAQKPDFVYSRNGRVHLNRRGRQFSRLLAAEVCASAVLMPDTPRSEVVWRLLATHSIRQFPLHFPSRASPCAITFQLVCHMSTPNTAQSSNCLPFLFVCPVDPLMNGCRK